MKSMKEDSSSIVQIKPLLFQESDIPILQEEQNIFIKSFFEAYKDIPLDVLKIHDLTDFLKTSFHQEDFSDFKNRKKNVYFYHAKTLDGKIVGYISLEVYKKKKFAYIRTLAVDPVYWKQGIGRKLVFKILDDIKQIQTLYLATRSINNVAINFYKRLNFKESSFMHESLDPNLYIGMEWHLC